MVWVVGVDEAGYGPNLGPLAQAAAAVKLPAGDEAGWPTLGAWVKRHGDKDKTRVLVDDSKLVHTGKHAFAKLEHACAALFGLPGASAATFGELLGAVAVPGVVADLEGEAWFDAGLALPLFPDTPEHLGPTLEAAGLGACVVGVNLVPAPVFNRIVAGSNSKATVLAAGLVALLARTLGRLPDDGGEVVVIADKQGGRAVYGHLLEAAFPAGTVVCELETPGESRYRVHGLRRPVRAVFLPEADGASVAVAAASCLAKYCREVCMRQFNAYWRGHLPDLKPTAGYPLDAKRFFADIRPAMDALGVAESAVWRSR